MAVPDFQSFFKPLLDVAADGKDHSMKEAREGIAKSMTLPEQDMREPLPSGTQTKFDNRVAWAKSYLVQARVLDASRRGHFRITQRGLDLHKKGYQRIDVKILNQRAYESIRSDLVGQVLDLIASMHVVQTAGAPPNQGRRYFPSAAEPGRAGKRTGRS